MTTIELEIEDDILAIVNKICSQNGLDLNDVVTNFLNQLVTNKQLPSN